MTYEFESPDEHALILGARVFGYCLSSRTPAPPDYEMVTVLLPGGESLECKVGDTKFFDVSISIYIYICSVLKKI